MASKLSSEPLGEHLVTCHICYEHLKHPKVFPCLHSFCFGCIDRHYEINKLINGGKLSCPSCRSTIPLPANGLQGLRNDTVIMRTKQILKSLPRGMFTESIDSNTTLYSRDPDGTNSMQVASDENNGDDTSDDETPSCKREYIKPGEAVSLLDQATGGASLATLHALADPPEVVKKRSILQKKQNTMQSLIAKMRNRILDLHNTESLIRVVIDKEVADKIKELDMPSKRNKKKVQTTVEEKYIPIIAKLLKEGDKLYQKVVDVKSINDVLEEVLERAKGSQILELFDLMMGLVKKYGSVEVPVYRTGVLDGLKLPGITVAMLKEEMEFAGKTDVSKAPCVSKDPRKINIKLLYKISGFGEEPGKFDFPTHATFMTNGDLIVSDKNNHRLQLFDKKGEFKKELFTGKIKPRRARINPTNGYIYVSDEMSESIKVFSPDGELVSRIGEHHFICTAGIDFDSKGNIVMTDPEKNCVSIHEAASGEMLSRWLFRYIDDRKMPNPYYVVVNEDDQVIITDSRNGRVKVFSQSGKLLFKINKLVCPRGVCVDPYGNILVAEGDKHRISMYNPYGKFVQYLIDQEEFGLCYPLSLDMDKDGRLVVTQCGYLSPHEVMVFQMY